MQTHSLIKNDRGAISTLIIILLFVFIGLLGIIIDLGHLHTVQNELRDAADACALRGARAFYPDSIHGLENADQPDPDNAKNQASLTIGANLSDNKTLTDLPIAEIQIGIWDYEARTLDAWRTLGPSDFGKYVGPGISVPVKRDPSHNAGSVDTTMAQIFGITTVAVRNSATAALSGMGGPVPGSPILPFGTWDALLDGRKPPFGLHGIMRNDTSDTLGWTNLDPNNTNPSASEIKKILKDPTGASTPDCPTNSTVGIQNGVASSCVQAMIAPNNRFGLVETTTPNVYAPDAAHVDIVYMLPVFDKQDNYTFNQSSVVGAVAVKIVSVSGPPDNTIDLQIVSEGPYIAPGYGGGKYYGILSTEPKLVQ
jgi:hypothetical protein